MSMICEKKKMLRFTILHTHAHMHFHVTKRDVFNI